jgi:hypothetical protein
VTEAPHLVAESVGRFRLDEVPARERHQRRAHVEVDERLHHSGRKRLSIHRRSLGNAALGFGKPVEPRREQRVDRVRDRRFTAFERGRQQLLDEERIPGRTGEDRRTPLVADLGVGGEALEQHVGLVGAECVEEDRRRAQTAACPLRPGVEELRPREAEQEDRSSRELGNVLHEVEERRRRPVQILEGEDDRPLSRKRFEQAASRPGRLLDRARRRRLARRGSDPRRDEPAIPLAGEDPDGPGCDAATRKGGEGVAERRERRSLAVRGCVADQTGRKPGKTVDRLAGQARLAHAGRAEHGYEARSAVPGCAPESRHDLGDFVFAPDEWRLEAADDRFGVFRHAPNDVLAVSPFGGDRVTDEAPRSSVDEHIALSCGGKEAVGLLDRRARYEGPAECGIPGDDVAGGDARTRGEPAGDQREGRANGAKRVILARHGNTEDPENASVRRATRLAPLDIEGCDRLLAAASEPVTPHLRVGCRVGGQVGEQDGDRLARLLDSNGRLPRHGRRSGDPGVLAQDRPLKLLERRARLRAELFDERRTCGAVGLERVRLPARAIEREHELPAEPLAEWVLADEGLELRHEVRVAPESQVGVDAALERLEAKLGEVRRCSAHPFAGQVGERISSPQRERLVEQLSGLVRLADARLFDESPEAVEIELTRLDAKEIAGRPSDETVAELAPQAEDVVLQRAEGRGRRIVAPDQVDELLRCDDSVRLEQQRCDDRAALQAAERHDALAVEDLGRPQNPELHDVTKAQ